MDSIKATIQAFLLFAAPSAFAQDAIPPLPPVPTTGVSPVLSWALSLLTVVISIALPIAVALLKQRLNIANVADRNVMIDRAVKRGALVSYGSQQTGSSSAQASADGLAYVKNAVPDAIGAVDQATDDHLTNAIQAEVVALKNNAPMPPAPVASVSVPRKGPF